MTPKHGRTPELGSRSRPQAWGTSPTSAGSSTSCAASKPRRELALHGGPARRRADGPSPQPEPPRRLSLLPPVPSPASRPRRLAAIAVVAAAASFCGALFTQNGDAVTDTFHRSDSDLGWALAISRVGVLVSLIAAGLADRFGRRRTLLVCVAGAAVANAVDRVRADVHGVHRRAALHARLRERGAGDRGARRGRRSARRRARVRALDVRARVRPRASRSR